MIGEDLMSRKKQVAEMKERRKWSKEKGVPKRGI